MTSLYSLAPYVIWRHGVLNLGNGQLLHLQYCHSLPLFHSEIIFQFANIIYYVKRTNEEKQLDSDKRDKNIMHIPTP